MLRLSNCSKSLKEEIIRLDIAAVGSAAAAVNNLPTWLSDFYLSPFKDNRAGEQLKQLREIVYVSKKKKMCSHLQMLHKNLKVPSHGLQKESYIFYGLTIFIVAISARLCGWRNKSWRFFNFCYSLVELIISTQSSLVIKSQIALIWILNLPFTSSCLKQVTEPHLKNNCEI